MTLVQQLNGIKAEVSVAHGAKMATQLIPDSRKQADMNEKDRSPSSVKSHERALLRSFIGKPPSISHSTHPASEMEMKIGPLQKWPEIKSERKKGRTDRVNN